MMSLLSFVENVGTKLADTQASRMVLRDFNPKSIALESGSELIEHLPSTFNRPDWLAELASFYSKKMPTYFSETVDTTSNVEIGSALNAERSASLGISIHMDSAKWRGWQTVNYVPQEGGQALLPTVQINAERLNPGLRGSWNNGVIKLGEDAFMQPLSIDITGTAIHELTHHEQSFLILCRQADELGLYGAISFDEEAIDRLLEETASRSRSMLEASTARDYLVFRSDRTLSTSTSERAERLADSFKTLWSRPKEEWGGNLRRRINFIDNTLASAEDFEKSFIPTAIELQNGVSGLRLMSHAFGKTGAKSSYEELMQNLNSKPAASWSETTLESARSRFINALKDAKVGALNKKRIWSRAYKDAYHEQEARFHSEIARKALEFKFAADS